MSNEPIYTLHLDDDNNFLSHEGYEEAVKDEIEALMKDWHDAGYRMNAVLRDNPDVTLYALVCGEEEERKKAQEAVVEAFREEAEDNIQSDWPAVPLTFYNFVDIFRELGADTVKALTVAAFG